MSIYRKACVILIRKYIRFFNDLKMSIVKDIKSGKFNVPQVET